MSTSAATKFNFKGTKTGGSSGAAFGAVDSLGLSIADNRKPRKKATVDSQSYEDYMDTKSSGPVTGPSSYKTYVDQSNEYVANDLGAHGDYVNKANEHIRTDPTTSPDFTKNWVNDGGPSEFANLHSRPVTNHWARLADAFNNKRWWNPGGGEVGTMGGGSVQAGGAGVLSSGERWEPITTQELEAQDRAEEYEGKVKGAGIERQDLYSRYPYDIHKQWQDSQMRANYQHDLNKANYEVQYGTLMRKTAAASGATGIYGRALWALAGIGGYQVNDYDRDLMNELENVMRDSSLTKAQKEDRVSNIFARAAKNQGMKMGVSARAIYGALMAELTSGEYGAVPENISEILSSALGIGMSRTW